MPEIGTYCRPLKSNVPDFLGATITVCQYCERLCWKTPHEPDPLPDGMMSACTECGLRRGFCQLEMDEEMTKTEVAAIVTADPQAHYRCLLCRDPAVAVYWMPEGCIARPEAKVQPLCLHHENKATPLGGMELIADWRIYES